MKSLRGQLIFGSALGTAAILLGSSAVLYALIQRTLKSEFDQALAAEARSLAAHVEREGDSLDLESLEGPLTEFSNGVGIAGRQYYELRKPDGSVVAKSLSLQHGELVYDTACEGAPAFVDLTLPDNRAGRSAAIVFMPRSENNDRNNRDTEMMIFVVARETTLLQHTLAKVAGILIAVCIGAVLISSALLAWIVQRRLMPLQRLSHQIGSLGERRLSKPIVVEKAPEEMKPIVDRLNDLLARLDEAFQRERRFTGDVSHELRTPIAGIRAKLELALSRERSPDSYCGTISDCLQISHQMQRMVENLLHLARADAGQAEVRSEPVNLSELMQECWNPLAIKARAHSLTVAWDLPEEADAESDREKLQLIVRNLLDNAVSHATEAGRVHIAAVVDKGAIELSVRNTAEPMAPEHLKHVFERFWRGDSSFRPGATHCGLGLSLCKTLVEQLGGMIDVRLEPHDLFTVDVRIPLLQPTAQRLTSGSAG